MATAPSQRHPRHRAEAYPQGVARLAALRSKRNAVAQAWATQARGLTVTKGRQDKALWLVHRFNDALALAGIVMAMFGLAGLMIWSAWE
jgi:hypothetical protein